MMRAIHIYYITAMVMTVMTACGSRHDNEGALAGVPDDVRPVAQAIADDDATRFASAVDYPLTRPYPLHDIPDSASMVDYYTTLVDDTLRQRITSSADSLWQTDGWRGWTLADGGASLWIDSRRVYQVDYVSGRERQLLDSLRRIEMASLASTLRDGWTPVGCMVDSVSGAVFRIDSRGTADSVAYRLAGYRPGMDLRGEPSLLLYGRCEEEGSMLNRTYHFGDSTSIYAMYCPDGGDEDSIPTIEVNRRGRHPAHYHARPAYWLDRLER